MKKGDILYTNENTVENMLEALSLLALDDTVEVNDNREHEDIKDCFFNLMEWTDENTSEVTYSIELIDED